MRWPGLLIVALIFAVASSAHAVPQPDAEAAFARGDYQTAFNLYMPLAEQGSVQAQERIAEMYEKGLGVPQDEARAREWYRRSAEQAARDAEMKMEAAQGMGGQAMPNPSQVQSQVPQYVPVLIVPGAANAAPAVAPLTPMPRLVPTVVPAAWPPAQPRPVQPFYLPVAPSHYHHQWHHR